MTAADARVKLLINAKVHLLNTEGDLGHGLNGPSDDECRVARGECGSLIWGGLVEETSSPNRVTCKRCRQSKLYVRLAS